MTQSQVCAVRTGVCSWCRAVVPFDAPRTVLHHEEYTEDPLKGTIEICTACHGLRHVRYSVLNPDIETNPIIGAKYEMVKVKCHLCGYEWNTESNKIMVTCPSCMRKTPIVKKTGDKKA